MNLKFKISCSDFRQGLKTVAPVVGKGAAVLAILKFIKLTVKDGGLEIAATNLSAVLVKRIPGEFGDPGQILVEFAKLNKLLAMRDPDEIASVSCADNKLVFKVGRSRFTIPTLPIDDFPVISFDIEDSTSITFPFAGLVVDKVQTAMRAVSKSNARSSLDGIHIVGADGSVEFIGVDGFRLMWTRLECDDVPKFEFTLAADACAMLKTLDPTLPVKMSVGIGRVQFVSETVDLSGATLADVFPAWHPIVPVVDGTAIEVLSDDLLGAVKQAVTFSPESKIIVLAIEEGRLFVHSESSSGSASIPVETGDIQQADMRIGLNGQYVLDIFDSEEFSVQLDLPARPVLFFNDDTKFVVMPMVSGHSV